jgi:hypothetical protein
VGEHKVVTGAHRRILPVAGSHEHPVGTTIEHEDGRRFQVGYGGERYAWHEVEQDHEAEQQTADQRSVRRAALEAELAALDGS